MTTNITDIQELLSEVAENAGDMKVHTVHLNAIQSMVKRLMIDMDEMKGKVSPQVDYFVSNYATTLRVIDLAFQPLMNDVNETVEKLNKNVTTLTSITSTEVKENEKADAPTSTR